MLLLLLAVLGMIFGLRDARAQTVTQQVGPVTVSEGDVLELGCNYSYSATVYLYWYVQYPGQGLQLLLRYYLGDPIVKGIKGFEAEFKKSESSFNLRKYPVHWSDSAVYFCAVSGTVPGTAGGAEHKLCET
uniref:Ig-like domain-containing protein n=1 Tax=Otolemur garnettii TaxID=30611 RepID=H0Y229_OTOGA